MSKDEIITNANELIDNCNCYLEDYETDDENFKWFEMEKKTIQGLLDLYSKEKEKNKTLEELLQGKLFELYKYYKDLAGTYQANCISKDKIRGKIEQLEHKIHVVIPNEYNKIEIINEFKNEGAIGALQELLEEKTNENIN